MAKMDDGFFGDWDETEDYGSYYDDSDYPYEDDDEDDDYAYEEEEEGEDSYDDRMNELDEKDDEEWDSIVGRPRYYGF